MKYLARKLLSSSLLLLAVSAASFLLVELAPGDGLEDLRLDSRISSQDLEQIRERYGLGGPRLGRYARWIASVGRGELGYSRLYQRSVGPLLWQRGKHTLLLTVTATTLAWLVSIVLGSVSAWRRGGYLDRFTGWTSAALQATPQMLLALAFLFLAARTGAFPTGSMTSPDADALGPMGRLQNLVRHLALPVTVLALGRFPALVQHVRMAFLEALEAPFVTSARASGLAPRKILLYSVLPATLPVLGPLLATSFAGLLSSSLVVEVIFGWPGLGALMLEAVLARDAYLVAGTTLGACLLLLAGNLLADGLLAWADPRLRKGTREP